jgi:hypothetical protein
LYARAQAQKDLSIGKPIPPLPDKLKELQMGRAAYASQLFDPNTANTAYLSLMGYLAGKFAPEGPWDYKAKYAYNRPEHKAAQDLGNFTFGAVMEVT